MKSNRDLFNYIQQGDEPNALKVLHPADVRLYLGNSGNYAIHLAAEQGLTQLVKKLLEYGANPYKLNTENENALSLAYHNDKLQVMIAIYQSNIAVTSDIGTFVLDAVKKNDVQSIRRFFQKTDPAIIQKTLNTWTFGAKRNSVLHKAVKLNYKDMVEFLINLGMDPDAKNAIDESAIDLAKNNPDRQIYKILCAKQAAKQLNENNNNEQPTQTSNQNSVEKNRIVSELRGRTGQNYADFIEYLSETEVDMNDINTLGAVESEKEEYYFKESPDSKKYAKDFLEILWANAENIQMTFNLHQHRYAKNLKANPKVKYIPPACLSFITLTLDDKKYCLVAPSFHDPEVMNALNACVDKCNQLLQTQIEYVLVGGGISYFNHVFRCLLNDRYEIKGCSEKYYVKCLTKLYLEFGKRIHVDGANHCTFYPFEKNKSYGYRSLDALDKTVKPYNHSDTIEINKNNYVSLIPCCITCQVNKSTALKILKAAQECGEQNLKEKNEHRKIELSPLRNSIQTTSSSLLKRNSVFQENRNTNSDTSHRHFKTNNANNSFRK